MAREGGGKGPSLFPAPPTRDSAARGSANSTLQLHGPGDGRGPADDRPMAALPQRSALFNKVNNLSVRGMRKAVLAQRLNGKRRSH